MTELAIIAVGILLWSNTRAGKKLVERTLSVYRGGKLHCCLLIFRLLPLLSQPTGEPFSFACKAVSPMGALANVPNSSCLEHLRFSYVYGFALFPFSWLSSILGFTEFS